MPWIAIHQRDQLKSAMSKGAPPTRSRSAEPTRNETFRMPSEVAVRRASAIFAGSGSTATTVEASRNAGSDASPSLEADSPRAPQRLPSSDDATSYGRLIGSHATAHLARYSGLTALKTSPRVSKSLASDSCAEPLNTSIMQPTRTFVNPAALTTRKYSSTRSAPAIQPVQRSMPATASSGSGFCTTTSAICRRPPGVSTR